MQSSSPPDPSGFAEGSCVGQRDHGAKTHFVTDDGIWLKTQQVPQKSRCDMDELLVKDSSIHLLRVSDLPTPSANNFRLWQCKFEAVPRVSVRLLPAMKNHEVELICQQRIEWKSVGRDHIQQ